MTVLEQLEAMEDFTYVEKKIASYILEHKDEMGEMTISGLAAATASRSISAVPIKRISLLSKSTPVSWTLDRR